MLLILLVVAFLSLPCFFCAFFHGDNQSYFAGFPISEMSVEFWGSFWISYISIGITALLTYRAYELSRRLGVEQESRQIEADKTKFRIMSIEVVGSNRGLRIYLPVDAVSVKIDSIESAFISFGKKEKLDLVVQEIDQELRGNSYELLYPDRIEPETAKALGLWFKYPYTLSRLYRNARLTVSFKYNFDSHLHKSRKIINICSVARVIVSLDSNKIEKLIVKEQGVFELQKD